MGAVTIHKGISSLVEEGKLAKADAVYRACSIVEGFSGDDHTEEEHIDAWQYLFDVKAYRYLQGWYGRTMQAMLDEGTLTLTHKE